MKSKKMLVWILIVVGIIILINLPKKQIIIGNPITQIDKNPSIISDDSSIGISPWSNLDNARINDNLYATSSTGASGSPQPQELSIKLVKNGQIVGNEQSASNLLSTTDTDYVYGAFNYLWGTSWMPSDINSNNFGITISYMGGDRTHYLKSTNFGFNIPSDAVISGIKATIRSSYYTSQLKIVRIDSVLLSVYYSSVQSPYSLFLGIKDNYLLNFYDFNQFISSANNQWISQ